MKFGVSEGKDEIYNDIGELIRNEDEEKKLQIETTCYDLKMNNENDFPLPLGKGKLYITNRRCVFISNSVVGNGRAEKKDQLYPNMHPFVQWDIEKVRELKKNIFNTIIEFEEDGRIYKLYLKRSDYGKLAPILGNSE